MKPYPSRPPAPLEPSPWNFPEMVIRQASPGLDVVVVRMPALPIVSVRWCFLGAGLYEDPERRGSAVLLQRLLRHGTLEQSASDFARQLDRQGIRLGTQVSADSMIVSVSALREHLVEAVQIANDVVFRPRLSDSALSMERLRTQYAHQQAVGQVEAMAGLWLNHAVYGSHPYGCPPLTVSGLKETTVDEIQSLHQRIVQSAKAMLLVVGDIEPHQTADALAEKASTLPVASTLSPINSPPISAGTGGGVWLLERPGAEQVAIGVGTLAPPRNHPDFLPLRVVNHVLGGGASSRLFARLRDQEGLTYGAYSRLDCGLWGGDWATNFTVAPNKLERTLPLVRTEIENVAAGDISEAQLRHSIQYLAGSFPQRACGLSGVSLLATAAWMHGLPNEVWRNYQANLLGTSMAEVKAVAGTWIRPKDLSWVLAGPPSALASVRSKLDALQVKVHRVEMDELVA